MYAFVPTVHQPAGAAVVWEYSMRLALARRGWYAQHVRAQWEEERNACQNVRDVDRQDC